MSVAIAGVIGYLCIFENGNALKASRHRPSVPSCTRLLRVQVTMRKLFDDQINTQECQ